MSRKRGASARQSVQGAWHDPKLTRGESPRCRAGGVFAAGSAVVSLKQRLDGLSEVCV